MHMLAELERLGTVAAVARALHLTPPGVSMQLAALERDVGVALTERRGRRVALTAAGLLLARHGRDIADLVSVAELEAAALREGTVGTYRVAAFPTAARSFVAEAWRRLLADPGPRMYLIELEPVDSLPALAAGEVDLAVTHAYSNLPEPAGPGLLSRPLAAEDVHLAVPAGNAEPAGETRPADRPSVRLAGYAHHDWIVPSPRWSCHAMVERACASAGFRPRVAAEATDFSVQLALVAAGVGVALVPALAATRVPDGVVLRRPAEPVRRYLHLVTRNASRSDAGLASLARAIGAAAARDRALDRV